ncbi:MAG: hypothetical protein M3371_01755, partial [Acidobacteriota bacterium]|nr:hypothetical protein [Acidobacteriota bacterium]
LTDATTTVVGMIGKLVDAQAQTNMQVAELAEAQKHTDAQLAETNERLNVFINVVERYISERRNGQSGRGSGDKTDESPPSS